MGSEANYRLAGEPGGFLSATYGHRDNAVVGTGLALQALHQAYYVGLIYLGAGALLWLAVVVLALVMR